MKNEQQQQARHLYFQTDLSKTQIAELLDVDRRTIYQWSVEGNWDRLKMAASNIPSLLVEKCYYLIGHFTDYLLSRPEANGAVSRSEVESIYKLTLSIGKLKKGSTLNENMEAFTWFLESMKRKDPALAQQVMPYMDAYINSRKDFSETHFLPEGYTEDGYKRPRKTTPAQEAEKQADAQDLEALLKYLESLRNEEPKSAPAPAAAPKPSAAPQPAPTAAPTPVPTPATVVTAAPATSPPKPAPTATPNPALNLDALMKQVEELTKDDSNHVPTPAHHPYKTLPTRAEGIQMMENILADLESQYPQLRDLRPAHSVNTQYVPRAA